MSTEGKWIEITWKEVEVGDIIKLIQRSQVPADMIILATSEADNLCFIETMNLDGETNLKIKKSLSNGFHPSSEAELYKCKSVIECEAPNSSLYTFYGNISINDETIPLSIAQILLRGCSLRNTDWVIGIVIYCGHDTKVRIKIFRY